MKKIFTLIAVAAMAISANAQKLWDLSTWQSQDVTGEVTVDGLTYYGESKSAFSSGNATFTDGTNEIKFTGRIKMGGASTFKEGSYSRVFAFEAKAGQNVIVFGTHGSSSGDPRTFYLSQNPTTTKNDKENNFASKALNPSEKAYFEGTVPADGTVYLWADNNNGIYAISVGYTFAQLASGTTAINTVKAAEAAADGAAYNLAGQKVNAGYKGLVIKNGKKVIVK